MQRRCHLGPRAKWRSLLIWRLRWAGRAADRRHRGGRTASGRRAGLPSDLDRPSFNRLECQRALVPLTKRVDGHRAADARRRSSSFGEVLTRTSRRCTPKDKAIPAPHAGLIPHIRGRTGFGHMDPYPVPTATFNGIIPHKLATTTLGSTASPARLLVDFDVVRAREAEPPTFSSHHAPPTRVVTAHFPFGPRGSMVSGR